MQDTHPFTSFPSQFYLNPLQRLLLVCILLPERYSGLCYLDFRWCGLRLFESIERFISDVLCPYEAYSSSKLLAELDAEHPVLFVITSGAEPTQELRALVEQMGSSVNLTEVSLGPDSVDASIEEIRSSAAEGLCLGFNSG